MDKDYSELWMNVVNATDRGEAVHILTGILLDEEGRSFIANLEGEEAELCVKILDHGIAKHRLQTTEKQAFFFTRLIIALRNRPGTDGRLPESMMIAENIQVKDEVLASGMYSEIKIGSCMGRPVAVKSFNLKVTNSSGDLAKLRKKFFEKVTLWSRLSHPNVLELIGAHGNMESGPFCAVTKLMVGIITEYVMKNHVNRLELLHGAAQGLEYLHNLGIAHGDINDTNILISNDKPPRACLADFDSSTMIMDPLRVISRSEEPEDGTITFMSPELLMASVLGVEEPTPTQEADIYAFGLVMFKVLTGKPPFRERETELRISVIFNGLRPTRPENASAVGFSDSLWGFAQRCWDREIAQRPKVAEVVTHLAEAAASWDGLMPPCGQAEDVTSVLEEPVSPLAENYPFPLGQVSESFVESPVESEHSSGSVLSGLSSGIFSTRSSTTRASTGLAPLQHEFETPELPRREESYDDLVNSDPVQNKEPTSSQPPAANKNGRVKQILSITIPGALKRLSSGPVQQHGHRLSNVEKILPEFKFKKGQEAEFIDRIDEVLENTLCDHDRRRLLNRLCKMCSRLKSVPRAMLIDINLELDKDSTQEYAGIGTDVYKAEYKGRPVAVKTLRVYSTNDLKDIGKFIQEAVTWRHLRHPNILPLLGMNLDRQRHKFVMVSEWMVHGNINEFLERSEGVNRVQLLVEAANGLEYMHSLTMVHGDLKGANILINNSGRACLADFGLSTIAGAGFQAGTNSSFAASKESLMSFTTGGTIRWMSPELLDPELFGNSDGRPTTQSDCYALGMVVYEVLCGKIPYWENRNQMMLMASILDGERPRKPEDAESLGFTDGLWSIVEECWLTDASARPDLKAVLSRLNHATWSWETRKLV